MLVCSISRRISLQEGELEKREYGLYEDTDSIVENVPGGT
jgi:hypothetical protein